MREILSLKRGATPIVELTSLTILVSFSSLVGGSESLFTDLIKGRRGLYRFSDVYGSRVNPGSTPIVHLSWDQPLIPMPVLAMNG